jgi:hypothetical protein
MNDRQRFDSWEYMTNNTVPFVHQPLSTKHKTFASPLSLSIEYYEAAIPAEAESILHALYGNVYSSMPHFRVYGGLEGASTFILRNKQEALAIFLYITEGNKIRILNEGMEVDETAVTQFANYIFHHDQAAEFISFTGVSHTINKLEFPFSQCFCTDDSVINLPDSTDAFLQSLGKATRKNIKQYLSRIKRDYPSFEFCVHDGKTIDEQLIRKIISLNRVRFEKKGKTSGITSTDEERIIQMIRSCGIVGVVSIDGKLCAGSLVYRIGEHYHSWLKAHDPAFDDYRLGLIGSYLMIDECIRRGGETFHLMWGREPHKALLNSELRLFSNLTVYRNHAAALKNCGVVFKQVYQNGLRHGKLWLIDMEKRSGKMSYPLKASLNGVRKVRAWLPHR